MKISKINKQFVMAIILLSVISIMRFFDRKMVFHSSPVGLLQNYRFAELASIGYYIALLGLFFICIKYTCNDEIENVRYLILFAAVFLFPMFMNENYFGAMDIYGFILMVACLMLLIMDKGWMVIPLFGFVSTCIYPMGIFTVTMLIIGVLLVRYAMTEKKLYIVVAIVDFMVSVIAFQITRYFHYFRADVQGNLSAKKFIATIILLCPYIFMAMKFFLDIIKNTKNKCIYMMYFALGLPGVGVYLWKGDYGRTIFYGFVYYIVSVLILITLNNQIIIDALEKVKRWIVSKISIPAVVIAYPFIVMTIWISGPLTLFVETFVAL